MRLKDERLNPGWEPRGYADVEILNPVRAAHFYFFLLRTNKTANTKMVLSFFFFFLSRIEIICLGQLLPGDEKAEIKYYVTVIVLLRKKVHLLQPIYLLSYLILSPQSVHVHMLLRAPVCLCACENDFSFLACKSAVMRLRRRKRHIVGTCKSKEW